MTTYRTVDTHLRSETLKHDNDFCNHHLTHIYQERGGVSRHLGSVYLLQLMRIRRESMRFCGGQDEAHERRTRGTIVRARSWVDDDDRRSTRQREGELTTPLVRYVWRSWNRHDSIDTPPTPSCAQRLVVCSRIVVHHRVHDGMVVLFRHVDKDAVVCASTTNCEEVICLYGLQQMSLYYEVVYTTVRMERPTMPPTARSRPTCTSTERRY
jgi:hypothetical protein